MIVTDYEKVAKWVSSQTDCDIPRIGAAIGWEKEDGEMISGVPYEHLTGRSITATIAVAPATGLVKTFLYTIFDYPFHQLGVEKILALIDQSNEKSIHLIERFGFTLETRIADVFEGGDMLVYTLNRADCRWLETPHGQEHQSS